jgi:aldose 1-epimerase
VTTAAPPSGEQHEIAFGDQRAVVTEIGATLRNYSVGGSDVIDGFPVEERASAGRGQVLAPWPNRLDGGSYTFEGRDGHAPIDEPERGNAIHGLVRWLPWRVVERDGSRLTLRCELRPQPAYPWQLDLEVVYRLGPEGLAVTVEATDRSKAAAPLGVGFHPYLTVGTVLIDEATITIPARRWLESDERGLPTAEHLVERTDFDFTAPRRIGTVMLDTCFTDLHRSEDGLARTELVAPGTGRHVVLWVDPAFTHLMVYTGDRLQPPARRRKGIAIEPMTCPPNALRSGKDVIRLEPDAPWKTSWGIRPSGVGDR